MARITMTQTFDISAATAKALLAAAKAGTAATLGPFTFHPTLAQVAQVSGITGSTAQINAVFAPIGSDVQVSHG